MPPIELKIETKNKNGRRKYVQALKNADNGNYSNLEKIIREVFEETTGELSVYDEK